MNKIILLTGILFAVSNLSAEVVDFKVIDVATDRAVELIRACGSEKVDEVTTDIQEEVERPQGNDRNTIKFGYICPSNEEEQLAVNSYGFRSYVRKEMSNQFIYRPADFVLILPSAYARKLEADMQRFQELKNPQVHTFEFNPKFSKKILDLDL